MMSCGFEIRGSHLRALPYSCRVAAPSVVVFEGTKSMDTTIFSLFDVARVRSIGDSLCL